MTYLGNTSELFVDSQYWTIVTSAENIWPERHGPSRAKYFPYESREFNTIFITRAEDLYLPPLPFLMLDHQVLMLNCRHIDVESTSVLLTSTPF